MRQVARALVVVVCLGQVVGLLVLQWRLGVTAGCLLLVNVLGAVYGVRAARRAAHPAGWWLVSAGRLAAVVADAALGDRSNRHSPGWWWLGAVCGLLTYVLLALGALGFPAQRLRGRQRVALASEAIAVLGCGFMFVWHFVLRPHLESSAAGARWPVSLGFPVGDLLLLVSVTAVVLRGGLRAAGRATGLLICGLVMFLLADMAFTAIGVDGSHMTGPAPATVSVVAASLCMTLAAMWAAADPTGGDQQRRPTAVWFSYLPYAAVGLGLALMVVVTLQDGQLFTWGGLVLGLVVTTAGVAARQLVSLHDSRDQQTSDPLTGLANRAGLHHQARRALHHGEQVAVLCLDLDGFKAVNDTYGQHVGDLLLLEFAHLLRATVRARDLAARIGGDEFAILQRDVTDSTDAAALGRRILAAAASQPITLDEQTVTARASIGIAVSEPGDTIDTLRHRADVAMYHAKRAGQHGVTVYEPGMLDRRGDDDALARDLETAVTGGQLRVLYQPMIDLTSGRPIGVEALVRWQHPNRGLVSPLEFIPIAERTGTIIGIGLHVLDQACHHVQSWQHELPGLYASVNLSARQLQDPDLVDDVLAVLTRTGLPPNQLVLEVTESAVVDDHTAIPALQKLRSHGIRIAIDDFGTGYSSLQYLTRLPVDILKIDRSFVTELGDTGHGTAITEAVIRLAQILDLTTVAEGIETPAQAEQLRQLGCRTGQGYLYAKPLPPDDAHRYLTTTDLAGSTDTASHLRR